MAHKSRDVELTFVVPGVPVPQGSKQPWGAEVNPHVKSWRASVAEVAAAAMLDGPFIGPVSVVADFHFPRPKGHYGTGRNATVLKERAPRYHGSMPDLDKLQRALGDALKGVVLRDDSQIALWMTSKVYSTKPRVEVRVRPL
jgi:Holliday junction resolvase RusA-like endonuclease